MKPVIIKLYDLAYPSRKNQVLALPPAGEQDFSLYLALTGQVPGHTFDSWRHRGGVGLISMPRWHLAGKIKKIKCLAEITRD